MTFFKIRTVYHNKVIYIFERLSVNFFKKIALYLFIVSVLFLTIVPISIYDHFGQISIESMMFHIAMPKKGMANDWFILSYMELLFVFIFSVVLFISILKFEKQRVFLIILLISVSIFDIYYINYNFSLWKYIVSQYEASDFIEKEYIDPKKISVTFPLKKQNLIFIQVESMEASMQDVKSGGLADKNYIPELTKLAEDNINFSASELTGGAIVLPETGWTMGALVAETAGIPLKSYRIHKVFDQVGNSFDKYDSFLTKVVSLGDILKSSGYENYFILGTSKYFAGQNIYMENHGVHEIYDYEFIKKDMGVEKPEKSWWGLLDRDVYNFSKKKLSEISKGQYPFSVIIQTIDTHRNGFLNPECKAKHNELIKNVYSCVSAELDKFISWIKKQDFYSNTTIVIVGDHYNMTKGLFNTSVNLKTGFYEGTQRSVYNAFINSRNRPKQEKNRLFSTMDIFPTTLSALGVKIEGNRLGLGTDLFSGDKTLLEKYGYNYLHNELRKKSNFYNKQLLFPD